MIELPILEPDPIREAKTVARCRERFVQRRHRLERRSRPRAKSHFIERAIVAGVSMVYLIAMVGDILNVYR